MKEQIMLDCEQNPLATNVQYTLYRVKNTVYLKIFEGPK